MSKTHDPTQGGRNSIEETRAKILGAIDEAIEDGNRDGFGGGVRSDHLTEYVDRASETIRTHLIKLTQQGKLTRVHGVDEQPKPRVSYLPSDHPDAQPPESASDHRPGP